VTVRRGIVIGVAGLPTVVPALGPAVFLYGLGLIVWFVWVGIVMLRAVSGAEAAGQPNPWRARQP